MSFGAPLLSLLLLKKIIMHNNRYIIRLSSITILLFIFFCSHLKQNELVIISPHNPEIRQEFSTGFVNWYQKKTSKSITIKWLDVGGTGEALEYIRSRNNTKLKDGGVDLFFGGGDYPFIKLEKEQLLLPYQISSDILLRIPQKINGIDVYQADYSWYGAALSSFGILYNKMILSKIGLKTPKSWIDLAAPEAFGWVGAADPRYSGSMHVMFELLLQSYGWTKGWEILCRIGANVPAFNSSASIIAKDVAIGQVAYAFAIDFYAFVEIERHGKQRLAFILPEGQTVINPDGIGIINNSPHPDAARLFLEYAMGDGQKLWIFKPNQAGGPEKYPLCRFPVDSTLYQNDSSILTVQTNPYLLHSSLPYNSALAGKRWALVSDLMASNIITPHDDLKKCYKQCIDEKVDSSCYQKYFSINLSDSQAIELSKKWSEKSFALQRIEYMNSWSTKAKKRYAMQF